jgi:hypothetical protein
MHNIDVTGKTKDNVKARRDIAHICNHPTLELTEWMITPRSILSKSKDRKEVMTWMKKLKFPDGCTAGLKRCMIVKLGKLNGLKGHDCHIIMERLMPIMLCGYLDDDVWKALAEISYFYRQLCTKEITKDMMEKLEKEILVLICKLEKIFPLG